MGLVEAAVFGTHLVFAGLWSGSVLFVTLAVLPTATDGTADAAPLEPIAGRLRTVSRTSALVLLLTGGHLAQAGYTAASLTGTTDGRLVLAMVVLWLALAVLVEVATGRLTEGLERRKVREPARAARPFLLVASVVAVLLLLDAGAILGL